MAGVTAFNRDLFGSEHLMIEDEVASSNFIARRKLSASLKQFTATYTMQCHGKYMQPVTLTPFWRITISLNEEPENLGILPPYEDSILDKLMLFKVHKKPMPMPTETTAEMKTFWDRMVSELPHLVYYLLEEWNIPADLADGRYGIKYFHHPRIVEALSEISPEARLLELIDLNFQVDGRKEPLVTSAASLQSSLETSDFTKRSAATLFHFSAACGTFLGQLASTIPERVLPEKTEKARLWRICPVSWIETDKKYLDRISQQRAKLGVSRIVDT